MGEHRLSISVMLVGYQRQLWMEQDHVKWRDLLENMMEGCFQPHFNSKTHNLMHGCSKESICTSMQPDRPVLSLVEQRKMGRVISMHRSLLG